MSATNRCRLSARPRPILERFIGLKIAAVHLKRRDRTFQAVAGLNARRRLSCSSTTPASSRNAGITNQLRLARAAGLPAIRLHDVRHSYATAALAAGIPAKVVSERLGHANIAITLDVYSHVIPGMDAQAANAVASLILGDPTESEGPGPKSGPFH